MRILTRITASGGLDVSSAGTDTITLGNSSVDKILANAPITASAGITGSRGDFNLLFVDGVQITASAGAGNVITSGSITGSGTSGNPITLKDNISLQSVTASQIFGLSEGGNFYFSSSLGNFSVYNKNVYLSGADYIGVGDSNSQITYINGIDTTLLGFTSTTIDAPIILVTASNTLEVDVAQGTGVMSITASKVDITGSLFLNGVQITGSTGAGNLVTSGNITGSGTSENPITLQPNISLLSVTASYFTGSGLYLNNIPNGALQNSSVTINDYALSLGQSFNVITGSSNLTSSQVANTFTIGIKNDVTFQSVSASFFGNGSQIGNLTASNIDNFTNDVRGQFSAGTNITINNGVISSSGGSGGTVITQGNITGSGAAETPVSLKDNISLTSVTASFFSGSGANITNLTASNITNFTNDVRGQFTAGTAITIVNGIISATGSAVTSLTGTANQVLVNGGTAGVQGNVTLTLPQSIGTTNSPTFANTTATTGYRLGSGNVYGLDIVNINASNRGIRLVSSSLAGAANITGDFVGIGTINGTSGVLLSSSANVVNSAPTITLNGVVTASSDTYTVGSSTIQGNLTTIGNTFVNGQLTGSELIIYNTSSLVGPTSISNTLLVVGTSTFLSNISASVADFGSLFVNGVQITGSTGAGNIITSGSVTGSGTEGNPIDLKPNVTITTLTASTGISSGRGDFSSLFVNGNAVSTGSGGGSSGSTAYDIAGMYNGKPLASETIFRFIAVRSYDFSTTSANHYFYSAVTSSASKTFDLYRNATAIGTVSFSANNSYGTVTINSASFVAGETFSILAPSSQDTTLSDLYFTFKADTV